MRVGTAEREAAAAKLNEAFEEGRLTLAEHDERLSACFNAVTRADLRALVADLPDGQAVIGESTAAALTPRPKASPPAKERSQREMLSAIWVPWAGVAVLVTMIWLLTGIGGDFGYFWPIWVIGPWGAVNVMASLGIWANKHTD
jgi:hypothetical protein